MQSTEKWLPVVGYEGLYEVSDHGAVRSLTRTVRRDSRGGTRTAQGRVISPVTVESGHVAVSLCSNGARKTARVHRLVLAAFVGPQPSGTEGCHNGELYISEYVNLFTGQTIRKSWRMTGSDWHVFDAAGTHTGRAHSLTWAKYEAAGI